MTASQDQRSSDSATTPVVTPSSPPSSAPGSDADDVVRDPAYDAVLLLGFGGPEGQDDVIPFLRNVTRGRGIPEERLETVATHYRAFGGVSPVNGQNRALRAALEAELSDRGEPLPVYWGNRNWTPLLADTVRAASAAGHTRLLAITTSAYSSYSSCRQYREDIAGALEAAVSGGAVPGDTSLGEATLGDTSPGEATLGEATLGDTVRIDAVRPYFDHPGFVAPFTAGVRAALARLTARGLPVALTHVLFTTHSIPTADAARSGPRGVDFGAGGAYLAQHQAVAAAVMAAVRGTRRSTDAVLDAPGATDHALPAWSLAFQSRSGPPSMPWLEPDVNDALTTLAADGTVAVVIVPIGFISDHMEVLWDLDTEAAATASALGMVLERVPTPGLHPAFVAALADLALERLHGPAAPGCPRGCCEKGPARPAGRPPHPAS